jgi:hypothetical protein
VDELEDEPGAGDADGDEDDEVASDLESSAFGAVADDDELELLDLSPGVACCWLWAVDELSEVWAMPAVPRPRIMSVPRTTTKRDFFMVHLPGNGREQPRCQ